VIAVAIASLGCTRSYYRRQADSEVNCIIDNKSAAIGSAPGQFRIEIDPRSRMYDPTNPDCPPMPPDDPTSHQLMHCVDCIPGSPCWRHMDTTPHTENPNWKESLPRDEEGNVVLDLTGAVETALLHSPEYQEQLENLYLSGLDVSVWQAEWFQPADRGALTRWQPFPGRKVDRHGRRARRRIRQLADVAVRRAR
jgi:hypothetical protein